MTYDDPDRIGGKAWLPPIGTPLGALYWLRREQPWIKGFLGVPAIHGCFAPELGGTLAWGGRIVSRMTRAVATVRRLPHWYLEDGFLRSVGLGKAGGLPLSIVADDLGLSTDASRVSRLERLILQTTESEAAVGRDVRDAITRHGLSKYNHLPHHEPSFESAGKRRLLLVDQVKGDVSVPRSLGSAQSFRSMLDDAMASGAHCIIRTHPDVLAGYRKGYLTEMVSGRNDVTVSADPVSAASVLKVVDEVWTVASQFGFDALLREMPVRCYAAPFYSGWGLTDDRMSSRASDILSRRRGTKRSIDQLAAAAFVHYPIYRDPETWQSRDVFQTIETIVDGQRSL